MLLPLLERRAPEARRGPASHTVDHGLGAPSGLGRVARHMPNREPSVTRDRKVLVLATLLTITPIFVDAVREGLWGWVPSNDSAATVLRARHAVGLHPYLVGMYTDASTWAGHTTYFPAAWQLYWLWAPTRVLGTTWGPLLAMAALNGIWIGLGAWMVARRLGTRAALVSLLFLAVLNLSLGMTALHAATPMIMVVPPFAVFLFGAWALSSGDVGVLPAMALLTNFLLLCHLVLSLIVPVVVVAAVLYLCRMADPRPPSRSRFSSRADGSVAASCDRRAGRDRDRMGAGGGGTAPEPPRQPRQPLEGIERSAAIDHPGRVRLARRRSRCSPDLPFWLPGSREHSIFNFSRSAQPVHRAGDRSLRSASPSRLCSGSSPFGHVTAVGSPRSWWRRSRSVPRGSTCCARHRGSACPVSTSSRSGRCRCSSPSRSSSTCSDGLRRSGAAVRRWQVGAPRRIGVRVRHLDPQPPAQQSHDRVDRTNRCTIDRQQHPRAPRVGGGAAERGRCACAPPGRSRTPRPWRSPWPSMPHPSLTASTGSSS